MSRKLIIYVIALFESYNDPRTSTLGTHFIDTILNEKLLITLAICQAIFWYESDEDPKTCFCMEQLIDSYLSNEIA